MWEFLIPTFILVFIIDLYLVFDDEIHRHGRY